MVSRQNDVIRFILFQSWLSLLNTNLDAVQTVVTPITKHLRTRNPTETPAPTAQRQTSVEMAEAQQRAKRVSWNRQFTITPNFHV